MRFWDQVTSQTARLLLLTEFSVWTMVLVGPIVMMLLELPDRFMPSLAR